MKNEILSRFLFENNLKQWQAADLLKMRPEALCRKLRYELPEEEQRALVSQIKASISQV